MMYFRSRIAAICIAIACATNAQSQANLADVVEYYNVALDHYFITRIPDEIAKLDAGTAIKGWTRTGKIFKTYTTAQAGTSPVCRYYIPPALGNSHFFGRGIAECDSTGVKNPSFVLEDPAFMHMFMPTLGTCPADTTQVYRVFSGRPDANHRYTTDKAVRDAMVKKGWLAEGDGPDLVVMCSPAQPTNNVTFFTETANPLLMSFVPEGGTLTTLFGEKDPAGAATAMRGMYIQDGPTSQTLLMLDGSGRPSAVTMADGSTMKFSWQSGGNVTIDVVTADGKNQASVALTQLLGQSSPPDFERSGAAWPKADPIKATLQVSVSESGIPVSGATVLAQVEGRSTKKTYLLPLASIGPGPGLYSAGFVNSPSTIPSGAVESVCNKTVETASQSCSYLTPVSTGMTSYGCVAVAALLASVGTPAAGAAILPACVKTFGVALSACTAVKVGAGTQSGLCKIIDATVALYDGDGVRVTATAKKGATSGSAIKEFTGTTSLAELSVNLICPPPLIPFNGMCAATLPLTKIWAGDYNYSVSFGGCKVSYPGSVLMLLTQTGREFSGNMYGDVLSIDTKTCQVVGDRVPIFTTVTGTIDGDNNIAITSSSSDASSIYQGPGSLRNGTLKVEISNTSDFGGLGTFSITLQ